jgi:hypothetical protein
METTQWRIVQQLPDLRTKIVDRLVGDTDFQSLCHDYDRCDRALRRFREQAETLPQRVAEYEQLLRELEDDIRRILNNELEKKGPS